MGNDAVEDIKAKLSVEDVISRYVELKRAGSNWRGLSPFNSEKTPSFMVSPEKQIWHDFSSGKGGNMFSFVMDMEGVDFKGALELLARQAGVDLSQYQRSSNTERGNQKQRLSQALDLATKFYQAHFKQSKAAQDYIIKKRKFNKDTLLNFRLGYSPNTGNSLTKFLLNKGFMLNELKQAGLSTQRYSQPSDMFRGRIMIPLMDPFGSVIGFTARLLADEPDAPKYINTPQTMLYDKSRQVFGLNLAKEAIRKSGYVVVVEGNLDVIASHQAGIKQVVATAGTAMTAAHLKIVGRLTQDVRLAFYQGKTGPAGGERTIPLASQANLNLSIITVTEGKDPDELIQKDPALWQQAIDEPQYALDWLIERYQRQLDITSAQGKREFSDVLLKVVRELRDSVEQDHYVTQIAKLIDVSPEALRSKLTQPGRQERTTHLRQPATTIQLDKEQIEAIKTQNHFMSLMLMQPGLRMYLKSITTDMLSNPAAKQILKLLEEDPKVNSDELVNKIVQVDGVQGAAEQRSEAYKSYGKRAAQDATPQSTTSSAGISSSAGKQSDALDDFVQIMVLLYEELYKSLELLELRNEAAQLQARLLQQYVKIKKTELASVMRKSGETPELMHEAKKLDELLKSVRIN